MNKSKGGDDDIGDGIGDMTVVTQLSTTHNTDQVNRKNKCASTETTTEEYVGMCNNLKKTIARIQEKIRQEKNNVTTQMENNLGSQINIKMLSMLTEQMEVAEVYSPPRVVEMANRMGMRGGWSLDVTTCDTDGMPWDFNNAIMRNRAVRKLLNDKPMVPIGSPMCTEYNAMNRFNHNRMAPEAVEQRIADARKHLEFHVKLYEIQWRNGRYFLHEHPDGAGSWQENAIKNLMRKQGLQRVVGDQCQYDLKSKDEEGIAPARKRIGFLTNAACVSKKLNKRCPNTNTYQVHRHLALENGRTRAAQVYPDKLCKEICLGIQEQIQRH